MKNNVRTLKKITKIIEKEMKKNKNKQRKERNK